MDSFQPKELRPGLWRWTAAHPAWVPGKDWPRAVGCAAWEPAERGAPLVLFDPQIPEGDAPAFFAWLERRRGSRRAAVLVGNQYHGRSAAAVRERLGASAGVWAPLEARGRSSLRVLDRFDGPEPRACGVEDTAIDGLGEGEVAYFIAEHRALVVADAILGDGGGRLRLAPRSWANDPEDYDRRFRASIERLLSLPSELALVSHGEPAFAGARQAIEAALREPASNPARGA